MFSLLINLGGGDLLQDGVVEGQVLVEGNTVETLETEDELVKQKFGFLVKSTDERMSLIEPEENVKGPFQFGEPDVKAGHVQESDDKA